ncbi:HAD hydrolase-like protein [Georgenia halophila]|uniref:HAD hydrolase-like protein n=1 Tax=Georgenia halophila TaxID=620889 RepID=A0ABP8L5P2_9MICO
MTAAHLRESTQPLSQAFDVALMDLDGVCLLGRDPIQHAADAVAAARSAGQRMVFVTNNASREPEVIVDELVAVDIPARAEDITTAAQATATMLADELPAGSVVLAIGGSGLRTALADKGFRVTTSAHDGPAAVVQGLSPDVGWHELSEAAYAIAAGARFVATNLDPTLPRERGMAIGNGSLVAAVTNATGVVPDSAGKPGAVIFHQAAERAGAEKPLVVGDRLDTDLAGARAAGYPGLQVLTGVNDARDVVLAAAGERPSFLAIDLRGLNEAHPAPVSDGGWWACGSAGARYTGGAQPLELRIGDRSVALEADGPDAVPVTVSLDAWRCLAAAAWDAVDDGASLTRGQLPLLEVVAPR